MTFDYEDRHDILARRARAAGMTTAGMTTPGTKTPPPSPVSARTRGGMGDGRNGIAYLRGHPPQRSTRRRALRRVAVPLLFAGLFALAFVLGWHLWPR